MTTFRQDLVGRVLNTYGAMNKVTFEFYDACKNTPNGKWNDFKLAILCDMTVALGKIEKK
jgi:hypothetical protein